MKNTILIVAVLLISSTSHAKATSSVRGPSIVPAYETIAPNDLLQRRTPFLNPRRIEPGRDDVILGEQNETGNTWYDYHSNGSVGKMIAVDNQGGVHTTWMDLYTPDGGFTRQQKYNYLTGGAWLEQDGVPASPGTRSGFGNIVLTREEEQRAVIFCHALGVAQGENPTTVVLVDFGTGWGAFESFLPPNYAEFNNYWPMGVVSPGGMIHVLYNRSGADLISYTGTEFRGGQPEFPDVPIEISPTSLNTYRIAQSPHSERAAITWIASRVGIPPPPEYTNTRAYQQNNDLYLVWTDDGEHWNFDNPLNVTNVIPTNADLEEPYSYGDTLRPATTHDIVFDADDKIHIVFEALGMWEMAEYDPEVNIPPVDGLTIDASFLFHWTEEDCTITPVADGWFSQCVVDENGDTLIWPNPGAWKTNTCNPSLAYSEDGDLYCVFNYFPYGDYNDYIGAGRCHGDVAVTVSEDNGETWYYPTMLVQTSSPLPEPGEGMAEEYPTLAERVDENLHVLYILDHEAGTTIQASDAGAANTLNEVYYLKVPVEEVLRDSIWEGPDFHVSPPESVHDDGIQNPLEFRLAGAYPNPFNSTTRIEYDLEVRQTIELGIYSTTGQQVAKLFSGESLPGHHQVTLDAIALPAGVYVVKLSSGNLTSSMKVALVK